ncbi:ketoreductase [Catellatospora sp. TT07R-123]|uniref:SDR family oxidoreductase n=1 Tax=Catellatospora sp. TT07R-123 TaxID=2733863 RepID=UPI001B05536E|nr:SDR family oxidoreductase [Catellatospora sp. TT07R-123]GHJ43224.1 ketoreductase [Catellatospora sp. TT07R-123]
MRADKPVLLLTGGAGVLGTALIDELADDYEIICLLRRASVTDHRVQQVRGDLAADDLGLPPAQLRSLAGRVDVILHAGAATSWTLAPEEIAATNVGGTARMLTFAEHAGAPFYYVSTAFVERPVPHPGDPRFIGPRAYVESKIAAEALIRDRGHPAAIVRPSIVIGDSRDGRISSYQGIHKAIRAVVRGTAPMIPADAAALIDAIPQDVVARATGDLIRRGETGGTYMLTAGPQALTVAEMVRLCMAMAARCGLTHSQPRLIPTEAVDRLLMPLLTEVIPVAMRRRFEDLITLMLLFQSDDALPTSLPSLGLGDAVTKDALLASFDHTIDYWATHSRLLPSTVNLERLAA